MLAPEVFMRWGRVAGAKVGGAVVWMDEPVMIRRMSNCCEHTNGAKKVVDGRVVANDAICREHYRVTIELPRFSAAVPGQFVQLQCCGPLSDRPMAHEWAEGERLDLSGAELLDARAVLLRRPFSIAGVERDSATGAVRLAIICRVVGKGSRWLAGVPVGHTVSVVGPLGRGFDVRDDRSVAWLVGGGVGLPPLMWLAKALQAAGKDVVAFCGARQGDLLALTPIDGAGSPADGLEPALGYEEFAVSGTPVVVATDDGTVGYAGTVGDALAEYVGRYESQVADAVVYTCGPAPMMHAVTRFCLAKGVDVQVSVERVMACGMGTCQSCVLRVRDELSPEGWVYKRACDDGPVFDGADVLWEDEADVALKRDLRA